MRGAVLLLAVAATLGGPVDAGARAVPPVRSRRCCVEVETAPGLGRPWCFILRVRPRGIGPRRLCRLLGGRPEPRRHRVA